MTDELRRLGPLAQHPQQAAQHLLHGRAFFAQALQAAHAALGIAGQQPVSKVKHAKAGVVGDRSGQGRGVDGRAVRHQQAKLLQILRAGQQIAVAVRLAVVTLANYNFIG